MSNVVPLRITPKPCPVCARPVMPETCEPWPANAGPVPWHVGCFSFVPNEHYVGVNGDTEADAVRNWNAEVDKIARGDFESSAAVFSPI